MRFIQNAQRSGREVIPAPGGVSIRTAGASGGDFIEFLARRYCPINAAVWEKNVRFWVGKLTIDDCRLDIESCLES